MERIDTANGLRWITPEWPAPATVRAATTLRHGGVSGGGYAALNLGDHVNDDGAAVATNRERLVAALQLPAAPHWLTQVHGIDCVDAATAPPGCEADACFSSKPGVVCAILTADCLPLLLCDKDGSAVAAVHAGWRGLAAGVIESAIAAMGGGRELLAWLGPAIGPQHFEVGEEVRAVFVARDPAATGAFVPGEGGRWLADLYLLTRLVLEKQGVKSIHGGHWCTAGAPENFYSYRRDGVTGRMATLIWIM